ncbi:MAG: helix-turn-helix transcriptional regulator [Hyphomicrobiales bacterium]
MEGWTFLTNHAHVLICIARDPGVRLKDVAAAVGITERAAQRLVADLVEEGYISRTRVGRRNQYQVHPDRPMRHTNGQFPVGALLMLAKGE